MERPSSNVSESKQSQKADFQPQLMAGLPGRRARTCPCRNTRCSSLNLSISSTEENVSSRETALQDSIDAGTCTERTRPHITNAQLR